MGDTALATAVASVVATLITVAAGYLTNRAAAKATIRNTATSSRSDLEKDAFVRADAITAKAMDRLASENREQAEKIDRLEHKVDEQEIELTELRRQLEVANRVLRNKFPDA